MARWKATEATTLPVQHVAGLHSESALNLISAVSIGHVQTRRGLRAWVLLLRLQTHFG